MLEKLEELRNFVLLEKERIGKNKTESHIKKAKNKTQRNQTLTSQKIVINNAIKLYDKRAIIIDVFADNHIYSGDVEKDVYYKPKESEPKFEESITERTKLRRQKRPKYTVDEFNKLIVEKERSINMKLFQKQFNLEVLVYF